MIVRNRQPTSDELRPPMTSQSTIRAPIEQNKDAELRVANTNALEVSAFIDERRLCAELGIASVTATKWRAKAEGPPFAPPAGAEMPRVEPLTFHIISVPGQGA